VLKPESAIIDHLILRIHPTIKSHIKRFTTETGRDAYRFNSRRFDGLGYRLKPLSDEKKFQIQASKMRLKLKREQTMLAVAATEDFKAGLTLMKKFRSGLMP